MVKAIFNKISLLTTVASVIFTAPAFSASAGLENLSFNNTETCDCEISKDQNKKILQKFMNPKAAGTVPTLAAFFASLILSYPGKVQLEAALAKNSFTDRQLQNQLIQFASTYSSNASNKSIIADWNKLIRAIAKVRGDSPSMLRNNTAEMLSTLLSLRPQRQNEVDKKPNVNVVITCLLGAFVIWLART